MGRSVGRSRIRKSKSKFKKNNKKKAKRMVFEVSSIKQRTAPIETLNDYCLVLIFERLSLSDLINVSATSVHFKASTGIVFTRKYAANLITVSNEVVLRTSRMPSIQLLKSFGHLIGKLKVLYLQDYHRYNREFEQAIIKYSLKYVTELKLVKADKFAFCHIERPLIKVTKVVLSGCVVGRFIIEFNKWFPNAQSLELFDITLYSLTDVVCIEQKFTKLEHLAVANPNKFMDDSDSSEQNIRISPTLISTENLQVAIRLNPQLRSLKLKDSYPGFEITSTLLEYISKNLPLLDELALFVTPDYDRYFQRQKVHFPNLRKIRFVVDWADVLNDFTISTSKPAELNITASRSLNASCVVFLRQNPMWRKIVFHGDWESYQSFECVKIHLPKYPMLSSIEISVNDRDGTMFGKQTQVLSLLNECKYLKKLKVCYSIQPWKNVEYLDELELQHRGEFYVADAMKLYQTTFEAKPINSWQSTYYTQGHLFYATYSNEHQQPENPVLSFWPIFWRV